MARGLLILRLLFVGTMFGSPGESWGMKNPESNSTSPVADAISRISAVLHDKGDHSGDLGSLQGGFKEPERFDYVVVGAGTAGSVMGYRLAEAGYSVALIEAGKYQDYTRPTVGSTPGLAGLFTGARTHFNWTEWGFFTELQPELKHRRLRYPQGKAVGGSSTLGYMIYHRAAKSFHDKWAELAGDGSYRLDPFQKSYRKAVTFHPPSDEALPRNVSFSYNLDDFEPNFEGGAIQVSYPFYVSRWAIWLQKALQSMGFRAADSINQGDLLGYHYAQMMIRPEYASRSSAADYVTQAKDLNLDKLKVFTNTTVTKLLFEKDRATGVHVSTPKGDQRQIIAKREVIVSAGALRTPQLLMVSGIGSELVLKDNGITVTSPLKGVGQNLRDQICFGLSYPIALETAHASILNSSVFNKTLRTYQSSATGPLSSNGMEMLSFEKLPQEYRDHFSSTTKHELSDLADDWPEAAYVSADGHIGDYQAQLFQPFNGTKYASILGTVVSSFSTGYVTIQSKYMSESPVVSPNWLTAQTDQQLAVAIFRRMRRIFQARALQPIRLGDESWPEKHIETDEQILAIIRATFFTAGHPAGTCRMGLRGDPNAVVDSDARVIGVQGLRVVDASALPILPPGYPGATILAFAEKIAESMV